MMQIVIPFLLILITNKLKNSSSQFIQPGLCDMHCHCPPGEAVVDCNRQDKLQGVPTNIPLGVIKLYIQDGDFPSPSYLTRANMTGLEHIEYLSIIYCNLQAIDSKTFLGMVKLKHLDLSRNAIRRLDMYTFFGLQLVNLYLQEQRNLTDMGLYIAPDAFDGLTAEQINLRGNSLTSVRYSIFSKVNNLHRLVLSDNRITQLDEEFSKHFNGQSYLLDLTGNPLECNCRLAWIAAWSADWAKTLPGLNMTCVYQYKSAHSDNRPHQVVLELRRLTADHLCPRARIQHIEVSISEFATRAILECTAVAIPVVAYSVNYGSHNMPTPSLLTRTPPEVAWQYVEGGHLREVRRLPVESALYENPMMKVNNSSQITASSTVRLNVTLSDDSRQYKCSARSNLRDAEEVIVTLRGPPNYSGLNKEERISEDLVFEKYPKADEARIESKNEPKQADMVLTEPHYLLHPKFSLMQMALAVVGTFLITVILLLLGARCFTRCHSPNLFRLSSSASSLDTSDAKVVYQAGAVPHTEGKPVDKMYNPPKQNGSQNMTLCSGQSAMHQTQHSHLRPQVFLSGIDSQLPVSPQFTHFANLSNPYFQAAVLTSTQPSSSSEADELQSNLAHLVSSPLLPNNTLRPLLTNESLLSPCLSKSRFGQPNQVTYWPSVAPGSPYSVVGSHEYDVPRIMEMPPYSMVVSSNTPSQVNASTTIEACNSVGTIL